MQLTKLTKGTCEPKGFCPNFFFAVDVCFVDFPFFVRKDGIFLQAPVRQ